MGAGTGDLVESSSGAGARTRWGGFASQAARKIRERVTLLHNRASKGQTKRQQLCVRVDQPPFIPWTFPAQRPGGEVEDPGRQDCCAGTAVRRSYSGTTKQNALFFFLSVFLFFCFFISRVGFQSESPLAPFACRFFRRLFEYQVGYTYSFTHGNLFPLPMVEIKKKSHTARFSTSVLQPSINNNSTCSPSRLPYCIIPFTQKIDHWAAMF